MIDITEVREQFPALGRKLKGRPIVFADNAATSLKPRVVIDAVEHYYTHVCANVHRGISVLAQEADALYEQARKSVARLVNAEPEEIVFVRNATEGINLAAHMLGLSPEDEIVCSLADHHSNFLPWATRAAVQFVAPDGDGRTSAAGFLQKVGPNTRLLAIGHVSNVTGMVAPAAKLIEAARERGILTLVDGAQSVPHMPIDVKELGCDFFAFSGHKMLGPSGIGALYARREILESGQPMLLGGGMVSRVTVDDYKLEHGPHRFEAGTPNIEGALGMGAAAEFLTDLGMDAVRDHSRELAEALFAGLGKLDTLRVVPGTSSADRMPIASFAFPGLSANDAAALLSNRFNVMVRSGVHCAEPLIRSYGEPGVARVSLALYNTLEEVDYVVDSVGRLCHSFARM